VGEWEGGRGKKITCHGDLLRRHVPTAQCLPDGLPPRRCLQPVPGHGIKNNFVVAGDDARLPLSETENAFVAFVARGRIGYGVFESEIPDESPLLSFFPPLPSSPPSFSFLSSLFPPPSPSPPSLPPSLLPPPYLNTVSTIE
jgi:hypothetical protein